MGAPKILLIDDDPDILVSAKMLLKQHYPDIKTENDPYRLNLLLAENEFDMVMLDMNFRVGASSGQEGIQWMKKILRRSPGTSVILMTAYGDIDLAVQAMREGATDFVVKPWENAKLLESVEVALESARFARVLGAGRKAPAGSAAAAEAPTIIGQSPAMKRVFETISKVGKTDVNVLILGENGTGKELIAQALHQASARQDKVFVSVDMGAIPESLFEAELFGHVKGAFTDAREDRAGRFEHAQGGTLFLDEIGNLSLPLQAKLLTALQRREITRVGSNQAIPVDIRMVAATNMPLHQMVNENSFRQDLLYRINTVEIKLPPLRERQEDIALLAKHYLNKFILKYDKAGMELSEEAMAQLQQYNWPGNIRELQHALERAVILADSPLLRPSDFMLSSNSGPTAHSQAAAQVLNLEEMEKIAIRDAILKHNGNLSQAARELGLGRTTLYRKMSKYGL